jgi:hypothetical protein
LTAAPSKKKLLYLAVCDPDLPVTGATVRMGAFVKYLGHFYNITLVNMSGSGHCVDPAIEAKYCDRGAGVGVTHRERVAFSQIGYFLFSPALLRYADRFLKQERFDYLLVDYGLAAVYGKILASRHNVPLIYSSHNIEHRMYWELGKQDVRRFLLAPYVYWAERTACQAAQLVITVSEKDRQEYSKWISSDRILVIPQGFDPTLVNPFYDPPPSSPPVVLFIGSFKDENNRLAARQIVTEILPKVTQQLPETKFQFIGADPPANLTGTNVEWLGFVDELAPYLQRANLVIAPMPFGHGISTKVIFGLGFGKVVLTTPQVASALPRIYKNLKIASLSAFADQIVALLAADLLINTHEFDLLCRDLAWPNLIARLFHNIEACYSPISGT